MRTLGLTAIALAAGSASASTLYVRANAPSGGNGQSWAAAYRRVHEALDAARANPGVDQIWVAAGTYTPRRGGVNRNDTFALVNGVSLLGGFAGTETSAGQRDPASNPTILSGDLNNNDSPNFAARTDNARHVLTATDLSSGRLDGFTIRGGHADFDGDELLGGGGAYILRSTYEISGCVFTDNAAGGINSDLGGFGGALLVRGGSTTVSSCEFRANRGMNGGAIGVSGFEPDPSNLDTVVAITDCRFLSNFSPSQTGGAMWSATGDPLFGGVVGRITVRGCEFSGNSGEYYGAWIDQNTPEVLIEDCTFTDNHSVVAGGALALSQTVGPELPVAIVRGTTFERNANPVRGSALFIQTRTVLLDRCVARLNTGPTTIHSGPPIGFSFAGRPLELRNTLVADNEGTGVFGFRNPTLKVLSSTIARNTNTAQSSGFLAGGLETSAAIVTVSDSIVWENDNAGVMDQTAQIRVFDSQPAVDFCIVQGLTGSFGGLGNLGTDARFTDPASGDYSLLAGSPAIDAGASDLAPVGVIDLAGNPRFTDDPLTPDTGRGAPVIDIGAYELVVGCRADFNGDQQVDFFDYLDFAQAFDAEDPAADFNGDAQVDFFDYLDFAQAFDLGC